MEERKENINVAGVYILDVPYSVDKRYDYFLPEELRADARLGSFVSLPFGKGNRHCTAVIFSLEKKEDVSLTFRKVYETKYFQTVYRFLCIPVEFSGKMCYNDCIYAEKGGLFRPGTGTFQYG